MKKIDGYIKLLVEAAKATPSPPVGPALGQRGVNIMEFCKAFNAQTSKMEGLLPVTVTVYADRSFSFEVRTPPVSYLLKKAAKIGKGSDQALKVKVGKVTKAQETCLVFRVQTQQYLELIHILVKQSLGVVYNLPRVRGIQFCLLDVKT